MLATTGSSSVTDSFLVRLTVETGIARVVPCSLFPLAALDGCPVLGNVSGTLVSAVTAFWSGKARGVTGSSVPFTVVALTGVFRVVFSSATIGRVTDGPSVARLPESGWTLPEAWPASTLSARGRVCSGLAALLLAGCQASATVSATVVATSGGGSPQSGLVSRTARAARDGCYWPPRLRSSPGLESCDWLA